MAWILVAGLLGFGPTHARADTGTDEDAAIVDEEDLIDTLLEDDALLDAGLERETEPADTGAAQDDPFASDDPFADIPDATGDAAASEDASAEGDGGDAAPGAAVDDIFSIPDVDAGDASDAPDTADAGADADATAMDDPFADMTEEPAGTAADDTTAEADADAMPDDDVMDDIFAVDPVDDATDGAVAQDVGDADADATDDAADDAMPADDVMDDIFAVDPIEDAAPDAAEEMADDTAEAPTAGADDIFSMPGESGPDASATGEAAALDDAFEETDAAAAALEARLAADADEQETGEELVAPAVPVGDNVAGGDPLWLEPDRDAGPVMATEDDDAEDVASAPVEPVAETPRRDPVDESLRDIVRESIIRRQARILEAQSTLQYADDSLEHREWLDAAELYKKAFELFDKLPDRQSYIEERRRARKGEAEAMYRLAIAHFKIERLDKARNMAATVMSLDPEHPGAQELLLRIERFAERKEAQEQAERERKLRDLQRRSRQPEYRSTVKDIEALMKRGRQHYVLGEYTKAQDLFESILSLDPFHADALALREKVARRQYDLRTFELQGTQQDMVRQIREAWRPDDYVPRVPSEIAEIERGRREPVDQRPTVLDRMKDIVIPELEFRQANINDVVTFLTEASRQYAPESWPLQDRQKGITIILNLGRDAGQQADAPVSGGRALDDPFAIDAGGGIDATEVDSADGITFSARFITLYDALKVITELRSLKYRVEGDLVIVVPKDAPEGEIIVRPYTVNPNFMGKLRDFQNATGSSGSDRRGGGSDFITSFDDNTGITEAEDIKETFEGLGVQFPQGSSIKYIATLSKLFVANTAANLQVFEAILRELDVVPKQVEIEARFVDIGQMDLSELGLEILLTDDYEVATKKGPGPAGARERISVAQNNQEGGFTRGLRFLGDNSGVAEAIGAGLADIGSLLTIQSYLTNPELSFILHALEQSGNANLLSAPKVLTQAGEEASIKVVREFIYPTEFQTDVIQSQVPGGGTVPVGSTVTPQSFETREVGVILTVLPEVSPEGHLITLTMTPQVVSGPDFIDYGSSTTLPDGTVNTTSFQQPIFFTREVTTRVIIYDGSTVVMGGMITEDLKTTDDKIPLLGDLPLVGRLFRSKTSSSDKRNLLIFVTARLVDPSGKPIGSSRPLIERIARGESITEAATTPAP